MPFSARVATRVAVVLACLLVPLQAWAQGTPAVTVDVASCRLTLSQQPPDASPGWRVQFRRGTGTSIGNRDSTAPYQQTSGLLAAGTYEVWGEWTTAAGSLRVSARRTVTCQGSTVAVEIPWTTLPPPPVVPVVSLSIQGAPDLPLSGTSTPLTVAFVSGTPTGVQVSRDEFPPFATWPAGTFFTAAADGRSVTGPLCITSACWGGVAGLHVFTATATYVSGATAVSTITVMVADVLPPPPPPVVIPAVEWLPSTDSAATSYQIDIRSGAAVLFTLSPGAPTLEPSGYYRVVSPQLAALPAGSYTVVMRSFAGSLAGLDSAPFTCSLPVVPSVVCSLLPVVP